MSGINDQTGSSEYLASEIPVNNFDIDYFDYKPVAKELATSIIKSNLNTGYVYALNGKWGTGKSSFLFYTKQYLTTHRNDLDLPSNKTQTIVLNFDPWMFSGHQDIVMQFFSQIKSQKEIYSEKISEQTLDVLNKLFRYGSQLNKIPTLEGQIAGWTFFGINKIIESRLDASVKSIFKLKSEIWTGLENIDAKIVIIIDDIDRLTSHEIRDLFRAIKSIADFPNIVYVLAYDEKIVIDALTSESISKDGIKYLEKIVQFTIPLPMIEERRLKEYTERIVFSDLFYDTNPELIESTRWTDLYQNGFRPFLRTPRSVIRLHNSITALYPLVKNEVNVIDFIGLLVIRHNFPDLYNHIREDHRFFINDTSIESLWFYRDMDPTSLSKIHDDWITSNINIENRKSVAYILGSLFPEISPYLQHYYTKSASYPFRKPRLLNISYNYETFLKYFRLQPNLDSFKNAELISILNSIDNPDNFANMVSTLNSKGDIEGTKALSFFDNFLPLIDDQVPTKSLENLILGLFKIKKEVITYKNTSFQHSILPKNILDYILSALYKSLFLIPSDSRLAILKIAFSEANEFFLPARLIIIIRQQNGDWEGDKSDTIEKLLNRDELKEIEDIYVDRLQTVFPPDLNRFSSPCIGDIIFVWNQLRLNDSFLTDAINDLFRKDQVLIDIISTSRICEYIEPIKPNSLEPIKTEQNLREKITNLLNSGFYEPHQKSYLEDFLMTDQQTRMKLLSDVNASENKQNLK